MPLLPGILLGNLELQHLIRLFHRAKQRRYRLFDLKIHRPVLDLQDDVLFKPAVQRLEMIVCGTGPVSFAVTPVLMAIINEASPQHETAVGLQRFGQHVRPIGMIAAVGERARAVLGVGLNQEPAEIGNMPVNVSRLLLPPFLNGRFKRVGGR
ncbi:hypothetical protein D3C77_379100 [compost metagenome]